MNIDQKNCENPFHLEAVATYGQMLRTSADLKYMKKPLHELNDYLITYPKTKQQYGAAIGLRGGHGSGKTHLLNWLAQNARDRRETTPIVLYAKADQASFFNLYTQLLSGLPLPSLQLLLNKALTSVAIDLVQKAEATASIKERIAPGELQGLYKEGNLNEDQLKLELQKRLLDKLGIRVEEPSSSSQDSEKKQPDIPIALLPVEIPLTLMKVVSPTQGAKAYRWLLGDEIQDLDQLGLRHFLVRKDESGTDGAGPDITAVNALETLAALTNLAETPLIILIDQLEVLVREPARQQIVFSVIKKMIEQLGQQKALVFIAGNEQSWEVLPRDVPPRLRLREPLRVGNLDVDETKIFLDAYTKDLPTSFSSDSIQTIYELSGGSPREIIRIAYHAFEKSEGAIGRIDDAVLVDSASESGSVDDRNSLALAQTDEVLGQLGSVLKDYSVSDGVMINRVLTIDEQPRIAMASIKATDKLAEIDSARRIRSILEYIERQWPGVPLIVVNVGYSSREIKRLLETGSHVLNFNEATFRGMLQTLVTESRARNRAETAEKPESDTAVLGLLQNIANRLDKLEVERSKDLGDISERFASDIAVQYEPERKKRELQTRWDLLDELDELQKAVLNWDFRLQNEMVKSILIANEANLKIKQLDYIGGLYLDLLSEGEKLNYLATDSLTYESHKEKLEELHDYQFRVITEMRRVIRGATFLDKWVESPWRYSLLGSFVVSIVWLLGYLAYPNNILARGYNLEYFSPKDIPSFWWFWPLIIQRYLPVLLASAAVIVLATFYLRLLRRARWSRLVRRARNFSVRTYSSTAPSSGP